MPLGISSAAFIKGLALFVIIGLATALYLEIKNAGANEQKIDNLNKTIIELNGNLKIERELREADQAAIKTRDKKIDEISKSYEEDMSKLKAYLQKVRESDECIDKRIPQQIQQDVFGS